MTKEKWFHSIMKNQRAFWYVYGCREYQGWRRHYDGLMHFGLHLISYVVPTSDSLIHFWLRFFWSTVFKARISWSQVWTILYDTVWYKIYVRSRDSTRSRWFSRIDYVRNHCNRWVLDIKTESPFIKSVRFLYALFFLFRKNFLTKSSSRGKKWEINQIF